MEKNSREKFQDILYELSEEDVSYVKSVDPNPVNSTISNSVTFSKLDTRSFMARANSEISDTLRLNPINSETEHKYYIRKLNPAQVTPGWKQLLYITNYYLHLHNSSLLDIKQTDRQINNAPVFVAQISPIRSVDDPTHIVQESGLHFLNFVRLSPTEWRVWFMLGQQAGKICCPRCNSDLWYKRTHEMITCTECKYRTPSFEDHLKQVSPYQPEKELEVLKDIIP